MRVLSGVQPSGNLHVGNYFGAIRQFLRLQEEHECFYFLADLHALTTVQDSERFRALLHDLATGFLALGLESLAEFGDLLDEWDDRTLTHTLISPEGGEILGNEDHFSGVEFVDLTQDRSDGPAALRPPKAGDGTETAGPVATFCDLHVGPRTR